MKCLALGPLQSNFSAFGVSSTALVLCTTSHQPMDNLNNYPRIWWAIDAQHKLKLSDVFFSIFCAGPDTNGCQFFITTRSTPSLNGEHVMFGIVIEGQEVIHVIEQQLTDHMGRPTKEIRISRCGLLKRRPPFEVTDHPRK